MSRSHILVVDDETNIRVTLEHAISQEGHRVDTACNGLEALKKLSRISYDLLLLDLQMEPVDGLEVLNFARDQDPNLIVIILTAYSSVESAVEALRFGAFDYLLKPASPQTICGRVREGLHHREKSIRHHNLLSEIDTLHAKFKNMVGEGDGAATVSPRYIQANDLLIDHQFQSATLDGALLDLTTTEFELLLCLVKSTPKILSARQLVNQALGYDCEDIEARDIVKWHIHHLRRKIEPDPSHPRYIKTIRHKGYMWRDK